MFHSLGEYSKAKEYLEKALEIRIEIGDKRGEAADYGNLGLGYYYYIILLPYIGLHSNLITKRLKSCVNRFYSFVNVIKVIFQNTRRIKSFFPYKDRLNRSQLSKVIYKANCWDCQDFYIGKTKRRLHDRKTEHFKGLSKHDHSSAIADHVKTTGHNINWDHFDILASGKTDYHCKVKETLFIQELQPALNANVSSEKLLLY